MSDTPSPNPEPIAELQLKALRLIAACSIGGLIVVTALSVAILVVQLDGRGRADNGVDNMHLLIGYGSLILVPIALVGAFLVIPRLRSNTSNPAAAYGGMLMLRMGMLQGPAGLLLVLFLLAGVWAIIAGIAILVAAQIAIFPTRTNYNSWRAAWGEPPVE